jgi:hypothetical protein
MDGDVEGRARDDSVIGKVVDDDLPETNYAR